MSTEAIREIEQSVQKILSLRGVAASVVVRGDLIEGAIQGVRVAVPLGPLVEQWLLLPADMRERRIHDLARRLLSAAKASVPPSLVPKGRALHTQYAKYAALLVAGAVGAAFGMKSAFPRFFSKAAPVTPTVETIEQAEARRGRVCEAIRSRIYAGASIGPFDTDGWVTELWFARHQNELKTDPALLKWVENGSLKATADEVLGAMKDGRVDVTDGQGDDAKTKLGDMKTVTLRFSGAYVNAYFDAEKRGRFISLAEKLATETNAEFGALYGRCSHLGFHDLGAWFGGRKPSQAAASVVYAMGMFGETASIDGNKLATFPGNNSLDAIQSALGELKLSALGELVSAQGGKASTSSNGLSSVVFPIGGPTRAAGAGRAIATQIGIARQ